MNTECGIFSRSAEHINDLPNFSPQTSSSVDPAAIAAQLDAAWFPGQKKEAGKSRPRIQVVCQYPEEEESPNHSGITSRVITTAIWINMKGMTPR